MKYEIVIIGTSAGGIDALKVVLSALKKPIRVPIVIVQHLSPKYESYLPEILSQITGHKIKETDEKEIIEAGVIYIAPPNFHLLIEKDKTFSLTVEKRTSYARPSIDVLFETAADAYREKLIGVILTGANHDGAKGLETVKKFGGYTLVQNPNGAYSSEMPMAAIEISDPDEVLYLNSIGERINELIELK